MRSMNSQCLFTQSETAGLESQSVDVILGPGTPSLDHVVTDASEQGWRSRQRQAGEQSLPPGRFDNAQDASYPLPERGRTSAPFG